MKTRRNAVLVFLSICLFGCGTSRPNEIVIGSKNFTEQAILGEILAQQLEAKTQLKILRRFYLSGTYICHQAMLAGRVDAYVEYTGTALTAILKQSPGSDARDVYRRVRENYSSRFQLEVLPPLGFNNTFAIVVRGEDARRLRLATIADAAAYAPQWRAGFGYEFVERPDGFTGLAKTYGLAFGTPPRVMDLGLLYRALLENQVDLVAGNSTDGLLAAQDLKMLEDNRKYFPPYQAVPIVRAATLAQHPEVRGALELLAGKISDQEMQKLNYAVDGEHQDTAQVVRKFLTSKGLL